MANLTKRYNQTLALDHLSLTVASGAVFGLLGPNGSGKSTFIRLVLGFLHPDAGTIQFAVARHRIGYLPDHPAFPVNARLIEYLELVGALAGLSGKALRQRVYERLAEVALTHAAHWRIRACSQGMLQRLALAAALLHDPSLLILDEPLNGLDPAGQHAMRQQILRMHDQGRTLLISTHRLNDIAPLCTHLAILHRGRLLRAGSRDDLLPLQEKITVRTGTLPLSLVTKLQMNYPHASIAVNQIALIGPDCVHKASLLRCLLDAGIDIRAISQARTTPEDLYLTALQEPATP